MTEEDLYPWKKKYCKFESTKSQSMKPPVKQPPIEEERQTLKRPKSDSSSDEMTGKNPKNLNFYFGTIKTDKSNSESKDSHGQTKQGNDLKSKGGAKENIDTMGSQTFRAENISPISNSVITDLPKEPIQVPQVPEYTTLPKMVKIEASRAKVND
jgi:hypothetical protein